MLAGVVLNQSPLEKSESSKCWWFPAELLGKWISCRRCPVRLFLWGPVIDDSFLLILPPADFEWYCMRAPPSGLPTPF